MMVVRLSYYVERLGASLGSNHALSNGKETEELTDLIQAFELQNSVKITVNCSLELHKGFLDTKWTCTTVDTDKSRQVLPNSALQSVSVWGGDYKMLMGVLTRLLYAMDFQLGLAEFEKLEPKKA